MAKIIIFSGAGISAESDVSTFRDKGGLWDENSIEKFCSHGCLDRDRAKVLEFYDKNRLGLADKNPNLAHKVSMNLKEKYPKEIAIVTQNFDTLFEKASSNEGIKETIIHLHGLITELRCESCENIVDIGHTKQDDTIKCNCGNDLRPNIVFFGESAPQYSDLYAELSDCELFISIGTSGYVVNPTILAKHAKYSILANLESSPYVDEKQFDKIYIEKATSAIKKIEEDIEYFMKHHKLKKNDE